MGHFCNLSFMLLMVHTLKSVMHTHTHRCMQLFCLPGTASCICQQNHCCHFTSVGKMFHILGSPCAYLFSEKFWHIAAFASSFLTLKKSDICFCPPMSGTVILHAYQAWVLIRTGNRFYNYTWSPWGKSRYECDLEQRRNGWKYFSKNGGIVKEEVRMWIKKSS